MKLRWTPEALADLQAIRKVIGRSRPLAADQVIRKIKHTTSLLAEQAHLGREGRIQGTREWVISGLPYIVPYFVRNDLVLILRVLHTALDWDDETNGD